MTTKLLIVSADTRGKEFFTENTLPDVLCVEANPKDTADVFAEKLLNVDLSTVTNIGIVFENTANRNPFMEYTVEELEQENELKILFKQTKLQRNNNYLEEDECIVPAFHTSGKYFSVDFLTFIDNIKSKSSLNTIDIISCNTQFHSEFAELDSKGITVRYSTNITGLGGDWILESHNVNVTPVYFTDGVRSYPYRLGGTAPTTQDGLGNWEITNSDNLYWLMTYTSNTGAVPNLSSPFILTANIDMRTSSGSYTGDTAYPAQSIGRPFAGGATTTRFYGTLDGDNYTVTLGAIDNTNFGGFVGNFGDGNVASVTSGYLRNITVKFAAPSATPSATSLTLTYTTGVGNAILYGLLCGICRSGTITNNYVIFDAAITSATISITNSNEDTFTDIGLLLGRKQINCDITNCYLNASSVDITINTSTKLYSTNIGGLIGLISQGEAINTLISGCSVNVKDLVVTSTNEYYTIVDSVGPNFGGLIGATLNGTDTDDLVTISNCIVSYNTIAYTPSITSDTGESTCNIIGGGLIGYLSYIKCTINNCTISSTNTTFDYTSNITTSGTPGIYNLYYGSFIGYIKAENEVSIINNIVNTTLTSGITYQDTATFKVNLGGLIGYLETLGLGVISIGDAITNDGITAQNNMDITITGDGNNALEYIGGMFGGLIGSNISVYKTTINSQSVSSITSSTNGTVNKYIGGIIGNNNASAIFDTINYTSPSLTIDTSISTTTNGILYLSAAIGQDNTNSTIDSMAIVISTCVIKGKTLSDSYIGGMFGVCEMTGTVQDSKVDISNCTFDSISASFSAIGGLMARNITNPGTNITNNTVIFGNLCNFNADYSNITNSLNVYAIGPVSEISPNEPLPTSNHTYFNGYSTATPVDLALIASWNNGDLFYTVNGIQYTLGDTIPPVLSTTYKLVISNTNIEITGNIVQLQTLGVVANAVTFENDVNAASSIINGTTVDLTTFTVDATAIGLLPTDAEKVSARAMVIDTIFSGTNQSALTNFAVERGQLGLGGTATDLVQIIKPNIVTSINVTTFVPGAAPVSNNPYALLSNIGDSINVIYTKTVTFTVTSKLIITRISDTQYTVNNGITVVTLLAGQFVIENYVRTTIGSGTLSGDPVQCLLKGTKVLTESGYKLVEELTHDDILVTSDGRTTRITEIISRFVLPSAPHQPYIIRKGNFGAEEDLYLSPHHAVLTNGEMFVQARELGLERAALKEMITYYHFTTSDYLKDAIIANGVPVETYVYYTGKEVPAEYYIDEGHRLIKKD